MRLALEDDVVRTAAERGVDESMSIAIQEPRDGLRRGAPQLMVEHLMLALQIARAAVGKVNPGGTLIFIGVSVSPDELYAAPAAGPRRRIRDSSSSTHTTAAVTSWPSSSRNSSRRTSAQSSDQFGESRREFARSKIQLATSTSREHLFLASMIHCGGGR